MKAKLYAVISRSVLDGIEKTIGELDERLERPMPPVLKSATIEIAHREVMREISEYVDFEDHE